MNKKDEVKETIRLTPEASRLTREIVQNVLRRREEKKSMADEMPPAPKD